MTKDELKIKVEDCLKMAEKMLTANGEFVPMLDIEFLDDKGDKKKIAIALAIGNDKEKRDKFIRGLGMTLGSLKRIGKIKEVSCVVMMSEAWFTSPSKEQYKAKEYVMPSQDPNRREMLMATGLTADNICVMRSKEMFSIEVKGKRHFTLSNIKEMDNGAEPVNVESNVLNGFFWGYKKTTENSSANSLLDALYGKFPNVSVDEMIERGIKVLTSHVGGVDSEFINLKK